MIDFLLDVVMGIIPSLVHDVNLMLTPKHENGTINHHQDVVTLRRKSVMLRPELLLVVGCLVLLVGLIIGYALHCCETARVAQRAIAIGYISAWLESADFEILHASEGDLDQTGINVLLKHRTSPAEVEYRERFDTPLDDNGNGVTVRAVSITITRLVALGDDDIFIMLEGGYLSMFSQGKMSIDGDPTDCERQQLISIVDYLTLIERVPYREEAFS